MRVADELNISPVFTYFHHPFPFSREDLKQEQFFTAAWLDNFPRTVNLQINTSHKRKALSNHQNVYHSARHRLQIRHRKRPS